MHLSLSLLSPIKGFPHILDSFVKQLYLANLQSKITESICRLTQIIIYF